MKRVLSMLLSLALVSLLVSPAIVSVYAQDATSGAYAILDFEDGNKQFQNPGAGLTLDLEETTPLIGSKSLKLSAGTFSSNVNTFAVVDKNLQSGYDGFILRLKTDAKAGAFLTLTADPRVDGGQRAEFYKNVKLLDTQGQDVTPDLATDDAWKAIILPEAFDGYILLPFSGTANDVVFDATVPYNLTLALVMEDKWKDTTTCLDNFGYYKGEDIPSILQAIAPQKEAYAILDFEDGNKGFQSPGAGLTLDLEETAPLIGRRSLRLTAGEFSSNVNTFAVVDKNLQSGYDGFILRFKTNAQAGAFLALMADPRVDGGQRAEFYKGVRLLDTQGQDVTPDPAIDDAWKAIILPEAFDGYIMIPFSGTANDVAFDPVVPYNLTLALIQDDKWKDTVSCLDSLGYYRGDDVATILQAIAPQEAAYALMDFEDGKKQFQSPGAGLTLDVEETAPLIGEKSLKLSTGTFSSNVNTFAVVDKNLREGYDGFILRFKTDAKAGAFLALTADPRVDGGQRAEFYKNVKLLDTQGQDVTPDTATDDAWKAIILPEAFDGYILLPFSGTANDVAFDPMVPYNLTLALIQDDKWKDAASYLDNLGYYQGEDIAKILTDLANSRASDPESSEPVEEGEPPEPTGEVSHVLLDFEDQDASVLTLEKDAPASSSIETENPLIGAASFKWEVGDLAGRSWTYCSFEAGLAPVGFDGVIIRVKTNAFENAVFGFLADDRVTGERFSLGDGAYVITKNGNPIPMNPASDTAWHGAFLPDQFNGYVIVPFSSAFTGQHSFGITLGMIGESLASDSVTYLDTIAFYKGTDFKKIIEEIAPGSIVEGEDDDLLKEEDLLYDENTDIRATPFIQGVLPANTKLTVERVANAKEDYQAALDTINPDAFIYDVFDIHFVNSRGEEVDNTGVLELRVGIPYGLDARTVRLLTTDGTTAELLDTTTEKRLHISGFVSGACKLILAYGFEPQADDVEEILDKLNNWKSEESQEQPGDPSSDPSGNETDSGDPTDGQEEIPDTGVTGAWPAIPILLTAVVGMAAVRKRHSHTVL